MKRSWSVGGYQKSNGKYVNPHYARRDALTEFRHTNPIGSSRKKKW